MYSYDNKVLHREKHDTTAACTQGKVKTSVYKQTNKYFIVNQDAHNEQYNQ